jgi:hypothetical protein
MDKLLAKIRKRANQIARKAGHGSAYEIKFGRSDRVLSHVRYGMRKKTTGQYVPTAYLRNFGWKNTYYQHAITIVQVDPRKFGLPLDSPSVCKLEEAHLKLKGWR